MTSLRTILIAGVGAALIGGLAAVAQDREPAERQLLVDLAYALGEAHALRQVCQGPTDQYWRERMMMVSQTEAADAEFDGRMSSAFNRGYAARSAQHPTCSIESRRDELAVVRKGEGLARRLATVERPVKRMGPDDPDAIGENPDSAEGDGAPR